MRSRAAVYMAPHRVQLIFDHRRASGVMTWIAPAGGGGGIGHTLDGAGVARSERSAKTARERTKRNLWISRPRGRWRVCWSGGWRCVLSNECVRQEGGARERKRAPAGEGGNNYNFQTNSQ